jgi:hypothetical protein
MVSRIFITALLTSSLLPAAAFAASADGFLGTWKIDASTVHMTGKPITLVVAHGMYDCKTCVPTINVKADGTPQAISGNPYSDHIAVTVQDDRNISTKSTKDGKLSGTAAWSVAPDGKTAAVTFTRTTPGGEPSTVKYDMRRVGTAPEGANQVSGSWMPNNLSLSQNNQTVTYASKGKLFTMTDGTGDSYAVTLDGKAAAYKGDPGITTVSVAMKGKDTLVERDMKNGKLVSITTSTLSPDGKTISVDGRDVQLDHQFTYTMTKQ